MAIRVTAALLVAFLYFTITVAAPVNDEGLTPPAINGELYAVPDTEVEPMQGTCVNPFNLNIPAFIFNVIVRTCQLTNTACGRVYVEAGPARVDVGVCRRGSTLCYTEQGDACSRVTFPLVNVPVSVGQGVRVNVQVQIWPSTEVCVKVHLPRC